MRVAVKNRGRIAGGLRLLRENAGLTQAFVATQLGITEASYCRWEGGQVELRAADLEALRDIYGVAWGTFFDALGWTVEPDYQPVAAWLAERQIGRLDAPDDLQARRREKRLARRRAG